MRLKMERHAVTTSYTRRSILHFENIILVVHGLNVVGTSHYSCLISYGIQSKRCKYQVGGFALPTGASSSGHAAFAKK